MESAAAAMPPMMLAMARFPATKCSMSWPAARICIVQPGLPEATTAAPVEAVASRIDVTHYRLSDEEAAAGTAIAPRLLS